MAMACELIARDTDVRPGRHRPGPGAQRLKLRLFAAVHLARGDRRIRLRIAVTWPWATQITVAITWLQALAPADQCPTAPTPERTNPRARGTPPTPAR